MWSVLKPQLLENAKKNLVFHFGVGRQASFYQIWYVKRLTFYYISLHILRGYVYSFCQIFQRLRLFKGLRLFQSLEQIVSSRIYFLPIFLDWSSASAARSVLQRPFINTILFNRVYFALYVQISNSMVCTRFCFWFFQGECTFY